MAVNTYKPGELAVTVGGYPMSGWADGVMATLEMTDEGMRLIVGGDGEGTYVEPADLSGTLTLNFKQDADSNRILGAFKAAGTQVKVTMRDNLEFNAYASDCAVKQHAGREYAGRELSNRTWVLTLPEVVNEYPTGTTPAS